MAALPSSVIKDSSTPRRSSSSTRSANVLSHGRGGAGNIGYSTADLEPESLSTPHLKGEVYTTGRGGTGNMARNTDPEEARRAQDVVAPPHREATTALHIGRGGAANVYQPSHEDVARERKNHARHEEKMAEEKDEGKDRGLAEKGKHWLLHRVGKE